MTHGSDLRSVLECELRFENALNIYENVMRKYRFDSNRSVRQTWTPMSQRGPGTPICARIRQKAFHTILDYEKKTIRNRNNQHFLQDLFS
jgi:hypothetical protein